MTIDEAVRALCTAWGTDVVAAAVWGMPNTSHAEHARVADGSWREIPADLVPVLRTHASRSTPAYGQPLIPADLGSMVPMDLGGFEGEGKPKTRRGK